MARVRFLFMWGKMVMVVRQQFKLLILLLVVPSIISCKTLKNIWNESPPPRKIVILQSDPIPSFFNILSAESDAESNATLEAWRSNAMNSFSKIKGSTPNYLSLDEIEVLIKKQLISLSDTEAVSISRIRSILPLLGFKGGIDRLDVIRIFDFLKDNRTRLRTFHALFLSNDPVKSLIDSGKLSELLQLIAEVLILGGNESIQINDFGKLLEPWLPETSVHLRAASSSTVLLVTSFFSSLCGDRVPYRVWNGKKFGTCLNDLAHYFQPLRPAVDLMVGRRDIYTDREILKISAGQFKSKINDWIQGHHHTNFPVTTISKLATDLDIPKPYHFFKLTEWLPKLNSESSVFEVSPTLVVDFGGIIQNHLLKLIEVTEGETCDLKLINDWKNCDYNGKYSTLSQLFNDEYATLLRTHNLRLVSQLTFYDALSEFLFTRLDDDQDGYLSGTIKDLITVGIRVIDSHAFLDNVFQRIQEKPVVISSLENTLKDLRRVGLSELAALAANIIPNRDNGTKRNIISKLGSQIYFSKNEIPNVIDPIGLTSFFYLYDLVYSLRSNYLEKYDLPKTVLSPSVSMIPRKKIIAALPKILYDHFPRLYNSCLQWGFERTCGVAFTEVLPGPNPGSDSLEPYEMDIITVVSIFMESMMSRCDRNQDDLFSTDITDIYDEKACVLKVSRELALRLMETGILDKSKKIKNLSFLVANTRAFRGVGKQALAQGSMKNLEWNFWREYPPFRLLTSKAASMGSTLSLVAELMDQEKVDAIEGKSDCKQPDSRVDLGNGDYYCKYQDKDNDQVKHEDAGDELIYLNQLSDHHLPRSGLAPRSSDLKSAHAAANP
jgi:hypothetical protein